MSQPIFTIDARGNILLEVMQSYFSLNHSQMFREINGAFSNLLDVLKTKQIEYSSLKNALVPRPDRNEVALVFDTQKIDSNWYGNEVFERLLPALDRSGTHSVLCGDYSGDDHRQDRLRFEVFEHVALARPCRWLHSSQFFIVYINNLSEQMIETLRSAVSAFEGYVGLADCNSPSFKTYLSMILCNSFLKAGTRIVQGHEDDVGNEENINMNGYSFEKFGYECKSLQSTLYGLFLSYKIEREVFPGFESDTLFSLNSISNIVLPLDHCDVEVNESKLQ
jgi:hypothetical protein